MYGLLDMVTQCSLRGQTYSHNCLVALRGQIGVSHQDEYEEQRSDLVNLLRQLK